MRENAIFLCKDPLILRSRCDVINVAIDGSDALKVIDLGNAFRASEIFRAALGVAHGRRVLVLLVRDNVMANAVQVVSGRESGRFGAPGVRCRRILLIL